MNILSVIPSQSGLTTTIHAEKDGVNKIYSYSHPNNMLVDPIDSAHGCRQWLTGREETLTEAIQYLIAL